jgi:hypothetical protein
MKNDSSFVDPIFMNFENLYHEKNAPAFFKIKEAKEFRIENSDGKNIPGP